MRKKKKLKKHLIKPDGIYSSVIVSQSINYLMEDGKKRVAERILYQAAKIIEEEENKPFPIILDEAVNNVKPSLETKSRKRGASTQRVPVKVEEKRALTLALR